MARLAKSSAPFSGRVIARRLLPDFLVERLDYRAAQVVCTHYHGVPSVIFLATGCCIMQNEARRSVHCDPGTAIVHPAGEMHSYNFDANSGSEMLAVTMPTDSTERFRSDVDLRLPRVTNTVTLAHLVQRLKHQMAYPCTSDLSMEGVVLELLGELLLERKEAQPRLPLHRVRALLHDRFKERLSLAEIAHSAHLSPLHLARRFRRYYGVTPAGYVRKLQMEYARHRLAFSSVSIVDLAQELSFFDQSHFCHAFKRHVGVTPSAYRQAQRRP
jgi:AraC family transcriptional regulator